MAFAVIPVNSNIGASLSKMPKDVDSAFVTPLYNLSVEQRKEDKTPMLSDLRESGSIEQDADMVLFINRNDYYKAKEQLDKEKNVVADIIIAKHRKGSTGKFQLLFELNMSNFRNYLAINEESD